MTVTLEDYKSSDPITWCPGCGDFGILTAMKKAMIGLELQPQDLCMVSGIGQAAKLPHYMRANVFNGLHGRSLPVATGIKLVNPRLTVVVVGGDGDGYAEGGNHFLHAMRRNIDITCIIHNNQVFALTKGQTSPTSEPGYVSTTTPGGAGAASFNGCAVAIASDAGFVARGFAGDVEHLATLIMEGVRHPGFSLIDVLQPCVTFNKTNTYQWYRQRAYKPEQHDVHDREAAMRLALEWGDKIPIGILYKGMRLPYESSVPALRDGAVPVKSIVNPAELSELIREFY